jgi:hypothetical protein
MIKTRLNFEYESDNSSESAVGHIPMTDRPLRQHKVAGGVVYMTHEDQELESQGEGVGNHEIPDTDTVENDSRPIFYEDAYEVELSQAANNEVGSDVDIDYPSSKQRSSASL